MEKNSLLEQEDYFKPYNDSIQNLKNNPEIVSFDRLCFELFEMNEMGKKFIEHVEKKFLVPAMAQKGAPTYQLDVMWAEGYKDAYRTIIYSIMSHKQRIKSETDKHVG